MRKALECVASNREESANPELLLLRYLTKHDDIEARRTLLGAIVQASRAESLAALYSGAFARWTRSFPQDATHRMEQLVTSSTSRLVIGLGSENVLGTGLRLHRTYGVPIIPGSALKGLASHYCNDVWGQRHDVQAPEENRLFRRGGPHHSLLFGQTDDAGVIAFHDAWIMPQSLRDGSLHLDVMTPHHPKWQANEESPPTDFDTPVPVSFLSVTGAFSVRVSWSGPVGTPAAQAGAWTDLAMALLQEALAEWGLGGQTSSGYGRLVSIDSSKPIGRPSVATQASRVAFPHPGETVQARLVDERTRKGGWKALHEPSGMCGPIQNSGDVPNDRSVGDALELIVKIASDREIAFHYPTPEDEARAMKGESKKATRRGKKGRGGREK